ncbi:Trp biosynthesis-associated membrane protein [Microbacterium esteraromaticum]|uniref:Trp biosynthesis-associated membrane protein n=1 Tax=Microbacterium esteraromaticum TaxID=57043 RepID=A0A7D8AAN9_9MICO|nr:Trp biosynthesis-associated membrane protein [Microbacterium esteraromaticum]QMU98160.1 Trp biosynthesis-associated membrane protein [Microbacterium esteraromaticum]
MLRRARMTGVLAFLLAGAVGIISSTQVWATVQRADAGESLSVTGAVIYPLLAPLSLAVLALGAALSIAGPVLRHVIAVLGLGASVALILGTVPLVGAAPLSAIAPAVTEATGLGGEASLREVVAAVTATAWPVIAMLCWVVLGLAAGFVLITARRWPAGGRRYRSASEAAHHGTGPLDAVDSWDELSHGTDPTDSAR